MFSHAFRQSHERDAAVMASLATTTAAQHVPEQAGGKYLHLRTLALIEPQPQPPLNAPLQLDLSFIPSQPLLDCQWKVTVR